MDLSTIQWIGEHFGLAGLILGAWVWDSMRKEKILKDAYQKLYEVSSKSIEVMTKIKTILQERLPGHTRDEEDS